MSAQGIPERSSGQVIAFPATTWALAAESAVLLVLLGVLVAAWLTARLTLDLGWGRSRHVLGPIEVEIAARRELVFSTVAAPYLGRTPRDLRGQLEVLDRGSDLVVAAHHTRLRLLTSTTEESVRFEEPDRSASGYFGGSPPR